MQPNRGLGGRIRLNQESGTPVYIQLADQLKYLIGIGELPPGSRLPSARHLSANLAINRNTVLNAYAILADSGYAVGRRGGGTVVAAQPGGRTPEVHGQFDRDLLALVDGLVAKGASLGLSPDEMAALVASHARVGPSAMRLQVAFVECNPASLEHYTREIEREFDVVALPFLLRDLADESRRADLNESDCVVSTFFHLSEVRRGLRAEGLGLELFAIAVRPHIGVLERLERLPRGSTVGVAYFREDEFAQERLERMTEALDHAGLRSIHFRPLLLTDDPDSDWFKGLDALVVRPENFAAARALLPPDLAVIEFVNELDAASRKFLREVFLDISARRASDRLAVGAGR